MRYQLADGVTSVKFVRPAHGLVALWGADIIPVQTLGLQAGRRTSGHRFMGNQAIDIPDTAAYLPLLETDRSDERRVGKECVSTCRSSWSRYHSKTKTQQSTSITNT